MEGTESPEPEKSTLETSGVGEPTNAKAGSGDRSTGAMRGLTGRTFKLPTFAIAAVAALIIGAGVAAAVTVPKITALEDKVKVTQAIADQATLNAETSEKAVKQAQDDTQAVRDLWRGKEAELKTREEAVANRETAVKATEQQIAANSFQSGGVVIIGKTVAAGDYNTSGVTNCYYAWKSDTTKNASIIDNNIVSGTATVTLADGDVFESNRCGKWTKAG